MPWIAGECIAAMTVPAAERTEDERIQARAGAQMIAEAIGRLGGGG